jgi:hypothetical protein
MPRLSRVLLGALLVVAALAAKAPTIRAAEPDKLLPADADTVVSVNIKQILDTDIVKKYALEQLKQALDGQDAKKLLTDLGLDPLKDIDRVVVGANVKGRNDTKFLMIVHGSFDPDRLYKAAERQSKVDADRFAMVKDGDTVVFKYTPETGENPVYGTVVNDKTVIAASDRKMIANALKAAESGKKAPIKTELADLVRKMDEKASVYACGIVKGKFDELKLPQGGNIPVDLSTITKLLPLTESLALSVKVGADVSLEVTLGMKDTDTAGEMRNALDDLIKQVKPLAALAGAAQPQAKPLTDILNTVKTSSKDKDVTVSGKVTSANIGKMMKPGPDGE